MAVTLTINPGPALSDPVSLADLNAIYSGATATLSGVFELEGTAYVIPEVTASASTNGTNLLNAYTAAKALTPHGSALGTGNRAVVLLLPGTYDLGASTLEMDTDYVDVIGFLNLDHGRAVGSSTLGYSHLPTRIHSTNHVVDISEDLTNLANVQLEATATGKHAFVLSGNGDGDSSGPNLYNVEMLTATSSDPATETGVDYAGTYIGVRSDRQIFGGSGTTASGYFENCFGGSGSFGETASGRFIRCGPYGTGSQPQLFGYNGTASGVFIECEAIDALASAITGGGSFGAYSGGMTGEMYRCKHVANNFTGGVSGRMEDCHWEMKGTNQNGIDDAVGAVLYNCTIIGTGSGNSVVSTGNYVAAHCRTNLSFSGGTNTISTPSNVDDPQIV